MRRRYLRGFLPKLYFFFLLPNLLSTYSCFNSHASCPLPVTDSCRGCRIFAHLRAALVRHDQTDKLETIRAIQREGPEPEHLILRHGLTEKEALEAEQKHQDRWQFDGEIAVEMQHYVGGCVAKYITAGAQNPIRYVNC